MSRLTLARAKELNAAHFPVSDDSDAKKTVRLNLVGERLVNSKLFRGAVVEAALAVQGSSNPKYVTLPRMLDGLIGRVATNGRSPVPVRNRWFQLQVGTNRRANMSGLGDMGDGFTTFLDPLDAYPDGAHLKLVTVYTEASELEVFLRVKDTDGNEIFTEGPPAYAGIRLAIDDSSPSVYNTTAITSISFVEKPVTVGPIELYAVNPSDSNDTTLIATWEPGERFPNYRRYQLSTQEETIQVLARRRFVEAVADTDEFFPANLGAIRNGLMALNYEDSGAGAQYQHHLGEALRLLNEELGSHQGGARHRFQVDAETCGFGDIPALI